MDHDQNLDDEMFEALRWESLCVEYMGNVLVLMNEAYDEMFEALLWESLC